MSNSVLGYYIFGTEGVEFYPKIRMNTHFTSKMSTRLNYFCTLRNSLVTIPRKSTIVAYTSNSFKKYKHKKHLLVKIMKTDKKKSHM